MKDEMKRKVLLTIAIVLVFILVMGIAAFILWVSVFGQLYQPMAEDPAETGMSLVVLGVLLLLWWTRKLCCDE